MIPVQDEEVGEKGGKRWVANERGVYPPGWRVVHSWSVLKRDGWDRHQRCAYRGWTEDTTSRWGWRTASFRRPLFTVVFRVAAITVRSVSGASSKRLRLGELQAIGSETTALDEITVTSVANGIGLVGGSGISFPVCIFRMFIVDFPFQAGGR